MLDIYLDKPLIDYAMIDLGNSARWFLRNEEIGNMCRKIGKDGNQIHLVYVGNLNKAGNKGGDTSIREYCRLWSCINRT